MKLTRLILPALFCAVLASAVFATNTGTMCSGVVNQTCTGLSDGDPANACQGKDPCNGTGSGCTTAGGDSRKECVYNTDKAGKCEKAKDLENCGRKHDFSCVSDGNGGCKFDTQLGEDKGVCQVQQCG